jgi:sugar phosphate permease
MWQVETAIALIGFLSYGPYSLLAGVFAIDIGGTEGVGTVAGMVDSAGYVGTIFAGREFGKLLDSGGYRLGFHMLALVTFVAAAFCLVLKPRQCLTE